jgi:pyochelin biosynthesis protein PchC
MGGLVAFEVAHLLGERTNAGPAGLVAGLVVGLVVSACRPPGNRAPRNRHVLSDADLIADMVRLGADPAPFEIGEIRDLALPVLRADLRAVETYSYVPRPPLECAITSIAGTTDPEAPPAAIARWSAETTGPFRLEAIDAGHFLLETNAGHLATMLRAALGPSS